jgi:hypothetical protein
MRTVDEIVVQRIRPRVEPVTVGPTPHVMMSQVDAQLSNTLDQMQESLAQFERVQWIVPSSAILPSVNINWNFTGDIHFYFFDTPLKPDYQVLIHQGDIHMIGLRTEITEIIWDKGLQCF